MMLVIQIALGIVLGLLIWNYFRFFLATFLFLVVAAIVIICAVAIWDEREHILPFIFWAIIVLGAVGLINKYLRAEYRPPLVDKEIKSKKNNDQLTSHTEKPTLNELAVSYIKNHRWIAEINNFIGAIETEDFKNSSLAKFIKNLSRISQGNCTEIKLSLLGSDISIRKEKLSANQNNFKYIIDENDIRVLEISCLPTNSDSHVGKEIKLISFIPEGNWTQLFMTGSHDDQEFNRLKELYKLSSTKLVHSQALGGGN